jgi:hypothetical protein
MSPIIAGPDNGAIADGLLCRAAQQRKFFFRR